MSSNIETRSSCCSAASCRGSAMTELLILVLPYAMIMVGLTVAITLSLGKQEAQKAAILASPQPEGQSLDTMQDHVFTQVTNGSTSGIQVGFQENLDYVPVQDYSTEEPVLPYGENGPDGDNDLHAGMILIGYRVVQTSGISGGEVEVTTTTQTTNEGRILEDNRIINALEDDLAILLNDWLTYSRATATFSYTYGGRRMHGETDSSEDDLRGTFSLVRDGEDGISYYSATRMLDSTGVEVTRGTHHTAADASFGTSSITVEPFTRLSTVPVNSSVGASQERMFASELPEPESDSLFSASDSDQLWNQTFGFSSWPPEGVPVNRASY